MRIKGQSLAAPDLLRLEAMSVFRRQLANGSLTTSQADNALQDLLDLPLVVYPTAPLLRRGWDLRDNVTAYDSTYVALAEALGCPLVTADRRLANCSRCALPGRSHLGDKPVTYRRCRQPRCLAEVDDNATQPSAVDNDVGKAFFGGGIGHVEAFEFTNDDARDQQIAEPLAIGRNHVPRRLFGAGLSKHLGERCLVVVPELAFFEIAGRELPVLLRLVQARLQAFFLLVLGNVQVELGDRRAFVGQQLLELADVAVAAAPLILGDIAVHPHDEHVFVVAAVEDDHFAGRWRDLVNPPQQLLRGLEPVVELLSHGAADGLVQAFVLVGGPIGQVDGASGKDPVPVEIECVGMFSRAHGFILHCRTLIRGIAARWGVASPTLGPSCRVVAGTAMLMLETERDHVDRVVLIADYQAGIGERSFAGVAIPRSIAFRTPLGDLLVDRESVEALSHHPGVVLNDRPFVNNQTDVVDVLERLWGERSTLIVASSSFGAGDNADEVSDRGERVREGLRQSDAAAMTPATVSSPTTLAALAVITSRRSMGLNELATDTIEDPNDDGQFVDIASFGAWESNDVTLADADVRHLQALALSAIHLTVLGGRVEGTDTGRVPPALVARRASVVTLRRDGQTRGSAGTIEADRSLAASVVRNAAAACADPRLPSIQPSELDTIDMSISIVSPIERIFPQTWDDLATAFEPGRHGVLVTTPSGRAAQLPAMWSRFPTAEQFVGAVAQKAKLTSAMKVTDAAWYRFETIEY
ncbi:Ribonuclease VapC9 [Nymphon striatum]|nr:Ribonuclease VapC9 [Nymphon striatum]